MAGLRIGRCTNFGNCSLADSKQLIKVPDGGDLLCPECRRPLIETTPQEKKQSLLPVLASTLLALLLIAVGAGWLFMKSCSRKDEATSSNVTPPPSSTGSSQPVLRMHGSNTIGATLAPALVTAFLKQDGASDVKTLSTGPDGVNVIANYPGEGAPRVAEIAAHGSATAFTDLGNASCDIGMASRKIKDTEVQSLASLGDMTSPASEHVLGLDGIAVIVNQANPVSQLNIEQLADLFSGTTTSWSSLGGPAGDVKIYARDSKSGTFDTFQNLVLHGRTLSKSAKRIEDSRELSNERFRRC